LVVCPTSALNASGSAQGCTDGSDYECGYSDQRKHDRENCHRGEPPRIL